MHVLSSIADLLSTDICVMDNPDVRYRGFELTRRRRLLAGNEMTRVDIVIRVVFR